MEGSPRKIEVSATNRKKENVVVNLSELFSLGLHQQVSMKIKVLSTEGVEMLKNCDGKELSKQDCVIGDVISMLVVLCCGKLT